MDENSETSDLILGMMVTIFEDWGPQVAYNESPLNENNAFNLSIKGMTLLGQTSHDKNSIYGPLPVPEHPTLRTLAYPFQVKTKNTDDNRIATHGRSVVLWLFFDNTNQFSIRQSSGLIRSYLNLLTSELNTDDDINFETMKTINTRLMMILASLKIKVYRVANIDNPIIEELLDGGDVLLSPIIIIVVEEKAEMVVLMQRKIGPSHRHQFSSKLDEFNKRVFNYKLKKKIVDDPEEIQVILAKYRIRQIQAPIPIN